MKIRYILIIFLINVALGIPMSVRSLLMMSHGATVLTIAVVTGVFAIATISAEMPTGIFADMYGRKPAYLIACIVNIVGCGVSMMSTTLLGISIGYGLFGIGTAFSSGSLDALIIEDTVKTKGKGHLAKALSAIAVSQCAGVAIGSFIGGFIPNYSGFALHLICRGALTLVVGLMLMIFIKETKCEKKQRPTLGSHIKKLASAAISSKSIVCVLICIAVSSMMLVSIEMYYQPQMMTFENITQQTLGIVTALGFVGTTVGSFLLGKVNLVNDRKRWILYLAFGIFTAVLTLTLAFLTKLIIFAVIYVLFYLILGMSSIIEQTIINSETSNEIRASMMSVLSFVTRMGIVPFSLISSLILIKGSINFVWIIFAFLSLLTIIGISFVVLRKKKAN